MSSKTKNLNKKISDGSNTSQKPGRIQKRGPAAVVLRNLPLSRSCDVCRKRKLRCTGPQQGTGGSDGAKCSRCADKGVACTYDAKYERRGPTLAYVDVLEKRVVMLQTLLEQHATRPQVAKALKEELLSEPIRVKVDESLPVPMKIEPEENYDVGLSFMVPAVIEHGINRPVANASSAAELDADFAWDELADGMDKMSLNAASSSSRRLYGSSSSVAFLKDARSFKPPLPSSSTTPSPIKPLFVTQPWDPVLRKPSMPPPSAAPFPFDPLARALFYLYFNHAAPFFLLLDRESFYDAYVDELHLRDFHFGGIVALVCAIGAFFANESDTEVWMELSKGGPRPNEAWIYFASAKNWVESYVNPTTVFELQFCALSCYYLRLLSRPHAAWVLAGVGLRLAVDVGSHRWVPTSRPPEEILRWQACFGNLSILDRELSVELGRSTFLYDEDSEFLGVGLKLEECKGDAHEVGEFLKRLVSLYGVFAVTLRTLYSPRINSMEAQMGAEWGDKILKELNEAKDGWIETIQPYHQWDPNSPDLVLLEQSAVIHATYSLLTILIHRPFISVSNPPAKKDESTTTRSYAYTSAARICLYAALNCSHIISVYDYRKANDPDHESRAVHFYLEFAVFSSGMVILQALARKTQDAETVQSEKGEYEDVPVLRLEKAATACIRHLDIVGKRWVQSRQYTTVLSDLLNALSSNIEVDLSSKTEHGSQEL